VSVVHRGEHLIDHPEGHPDGEDAHGDADHDEGGAQLVMPQVEPNLMPDDSHTDALYCLR